ncbi:hypothetical protein NG799_17925 [Laspinema sp. D1]|uniref:Uncharacterized protein n=1 Tax=Laspinema palackyanum D2a TaxID=2953684 RepID=A0ABT2MTW9_9CYAN|nr:hypothetical protein [Laspinema sp. D2a]
MEPFLLPLEIMPFDAAPRLCYGRIRTELKRVGLLIGNLVSEEGYGYYPGQFLRKGDEFWSEFCRGGKSFSAEEEGDSPLQLIVDTEVHKMGLLKFW